MSQLSARSVTSFALLILATPLFALPHIHRGPTSPKASKHFPRGHAASPHAVSRVAAPAGISAERATQIQGALIRSGYMTGEPTGVWDSTTQAALVKMQGENGWQTKLVPDSRAIIKLGLGPGSTIAESGRAETATPEQVNSFDSAANR